MTEGERERAAVVRYIETLIEGAEQTGNHATAFWLDVLLGDIKSGEHLKEGR